MMADESGAETVQYEDGDADTCNRDAAYESAQSAQESLDGAWGLVSRATRRKGQGKVKPHEERLTATRKGMGSPSLAAGAAAAPPAARRCAMEFSPGTTSQSVDAVFEMVKALREDVLRREAAAEAAAAAAAAEAARRQDEANRRNQQQMETIADLAAKIDIIANALDQTQQKTTALSYMCEILAHRLDVLGAPSMAGGLQMPPTATAFAQGPVTTEQAGAADCARTGDSTLDSATEDVGMPEAPNRGRKGARSETMSEDESDLGRPRAKKPAQEDYESAAETEGLKQL